MAYNEKKKLTNQAWDARNADRLKQIGVILDVQTKDRIEGVAQKYGLSASKYCRERILQAVESDLRSLGMTAEQAQAIGANKRMQAEQAAAEKKRMAERQKFGLD